ncbi:MAG: hypothetical protein CM1200mP14_12940 [Gammaproteobacteria bacterium]|nr:MAG: hypothetical protein CM1200mP14_12940 [Gammaproteobacteria bacterium]
MTDWYDRWVGTEYEGANPPELYHHYIGHDNNRMRSCRTRSSLGMGLRSSSGMDPSGLHRSPPDGTLYSENLFTSLAEPIRPGGRPLVWREMSWYGAHMAYKMEEEDLSGAVNAAIYSGWGHFGFHWITPFQISPAC